MHQMVYHMVVLFLQTTFLAILATSVTLHSTGITILVACCVIIHLISSLNNQSYWSILNYGNALLRLESCFSCITFYRKETSWWSEDKINIYAQDAKQEKKNKRKQPNTKENFPLQDWTKLSQQHPFQNGRESFSWSQKTNLWHEFQQRKESYSGQRDSGSGWDPNYSRDAHQRN